MLLGCWILTLKRKHTKTDSAQAATEKLSGRVPMKCSMLKVQASLCRPAVVPAEIKSAGF